MATASYDFGRQMFDMLPAIYHRYDTTSTNPHVVDRDREKGFLRRFLDLTGAQLDQLYSLARAAVDLHDPDRVDGQLLPLLAQWIGWRTDYRASVGTQRREIRNAPKIYEHIGTFEALDATARRVSGLQFRAKEYVHNVARTNEPERLNIWGTTRTDPAASWSTPELISLNYSFDGRPAHVQDGADGLLLYHTRRRHGSPQTAQPGPGPADTAVQSWDIWAKTRTSAGIWNASGPLVGRIADDKFPAAAQFGGLFWLFWETYDPGEPAPQRRRRIAFATRPIDGTTWSEPTVSGQPGAVFLGSDDAERRRPVVAVDESGLWLFWQERSGDRWDIRYNHHTGNDVTAWQPTAPKTLEQPDDSRIQDDLFLLTRPGPDKRLWLFGVRRGPQAAGDRQDRWVISYRVKNGLDPDVDDWQPAHTVPSPGGGNDREPAPVLGNGDRIEMFFSSTRAADPATPPDGTWSVFRAELSDPTTNAWSPAQPVAADLGSQRAPLAIQTDGSTLVVYRSSQPVAHPRTNGEVAIDNRDAGALTFRGKRSVTYGGFDDLQTYTFTTPSHGGRNDGRIARDAVGLFPVQSRSAALTPAQTNAAIDHLKAIAPEFLPVNTRAIFIQDQ
jgi:phage tail-like protein